MNKLTSPTLAILQRQEFWAALLAIGIGSAFAYFSRNYSFGSLRSIGVGFMPIVLSAGMMLLGLVLLVRSICSSGPAERIHIRSVVPILLSIGAFAFLVQYGLVTAILGTTLISRVAQPRGSLLEAGLLAIFLSVLCVLIFIIGLGEPIAIGPF